MRPWHGFRFRINARGYRALWFSAAVLFAAPAQAEGLRVFAAASLTEALDQALDVCETATGLSATGVYAGSGTIARQIEQGAPADIYISANPQWMDWLEKRGMIVGETRIDLVGNDLVLISVRKAETKLYLEDGADWIDVITSPIPSKIALADMQTVPAGIYARQAMENAGLLKDPELNARLVQASNVREALSWVNRRELGLGFVYRSDAARIDVIGVFPVPSDLHDPIRYPAAVIADSNSPDAKRLLACLSGEEASEVFQAFGFTSLTD